jgi:hypothetical protein
MVRGLGSKWKKAAVIFDEEIKYDYAIDLIAEIETVSRALKDRVRMKTDAEFKAAHELYVYECERAALVEDMLQQCEEGESSRFFLLAYIKEIRGALIKSLRDIESMPRFSERHPWKEAMRKLFH